MAPSCSLVKARSPAPAEQPLSTARVIAVHSLRGGVGGSTISANLTAALAQIWKVEAILVDLVLTSGQAVLMLNLPLRNTWADIAHIPNDEIDKELVDVLLRPHSSGASVLPAPGHAEEAELIDAHKVKRVLEIISANYEYILLDLPHDFSPTTLDGLDATDVILSVLTPDLASVRSTAPPGGAW